MTESGISLTDYLRVLAKRRRLVAYIAGAAFAISCAAAFIVPREYEATASILPPQQDSISGLASKAESAGVPASLLSGMLSFSNDVWAGMLKSQSVSDPIIARFNLRKVYGRKKIEDVRKRLWKKVDIAKDRKENILTIAVLDKDPARAAGMANAFVEELDKVNKNVTMTSGMRTRMFVEERLKETRSDLERTEDAIEAFQRRNRAVALDNQTKVIIESIGEVKGRLMAKQVELQTLLSYAAPTNPRVQLLRSEEGELNQRLRELESRGGGRYGARDSQDIFVPTGMMPALAKEYMRLMRAKTVQETLYKLLMQQYELAGIQEVKDSPTLQVLDYAKAPEKAARPRKLLIVVSSTFLGMVVAVLTALLLEYREAGHGK